MGNRSCGNLQSARQVALALSVVQRHVTMSRPIHGKSRPAELTTSPITTSDIGGAQ